MGELTITNAIASDMTNVVKDYSIAAKSMDSAQNQDETFYINNNWTKQWGYFNAVSDLKSAILLKSIWNVGKGWDADAEVKVILDHISGWGKDTFDDIIFNMEVIKRIGGDAFAEIIRDKDTNTIINLKPLNPETMKIIVDKNGRIKRYEQINRINANNEIRFEPDEIFHLSNNRLGDQIHGISDIDAVEKIILADEESLDDMKKIMHRQARPMIMFKLGTDNATIINAFVAKMDAAMNKGENIYIPDDKNSVDYEVIQINMNQLILEWRNDLRNKFYRTIGLPQIVPGGGGQSTESESKVIYLAFEQIVEKDQRALELQIWNQLGLKINFIPPASLMENLQQDQAKDTGQLNPMMNMAGMEE